MRRTRARIGGAACAALLLLTACGGDEPPAPETAAAAVTTTAVPPATTSVPVLAIIPPTTTTVAPATTAAPVTTAVAGPAGVAGPAEAMAAVEAAIELAEAEGLDAVGARWGAPDAPAWLYVLDGAATVVVHPSPELGGAVAVGELGADAFGYVFMERVMAAPPEGHWVTYLAVPDRPGTLDAAGAPDPGPASGSIAEAFYADDLTIRYLWARAAGGHVFVSSWAGAATGFVEYVLRASARLAQAGGLDASTAATRDPQSILAATLAMMDHHRAGTGRGGAFVGFAAGPDGTILDSMLNPALAGQNAADIVGAEVLAQATPEGAWATDPDRGLRVFLVTLGSVVIAGGAMNAPAP